jgi:hypothetical protein
MNHFVVITTIPKFLSLALFDTPAGLDSELEINSSSRGVWMEELE